MRVCLLGNGGTDIPKSLMLGMQLDGLCLYTFPEMLPLQNTAEPVVSLSA